MALFKFVSKCWYDYTISASGTASKILMSSMRSWNVKLHLKIWRIGMQRLVVLYISTNV